MTDDDGTPQPNSDGYFEPYSQAARTLRGWFVAFSVGVPAILLANEDALETLAASGEARCLCFTFLAGACLQVLIAFAYKHCMSYLYTYGNEDMPGPVRLLTGHVWPELVIDIATIALLGFALFRLVCILTGP